MQRRAAFLIDKILKSLLIKAFVFCLVAHLTKKGVYYVRKTSF